MTADRAKRPTANGNRSPLTVWQNAVADSELPGGVRHVLHVLSLDMDVKAAGAYSSRDRLARRADLSPRQITRLLAVACERGWLDRRKRDGKTTRYDALIPTLDAGVTPDTHVQGGARHGRPGGVTPVSRDPGHRCPPDRGSDRGADRGSEVIDEEDKSQTLTPQEQAARAREARELLGSLEQSTDLGAATDLGPLDGRPQTKDRTQKRRSS